MTQKEDLAKKLGSLIFAAHEPPRRRAAEGVPSAKKRNFALVMNPFSIVTR